MDYKIIMPDEFKCYKNISGVYAIVNTIQRTPHCELGKVYVGQSVSVGRRLASHVYYLNKTIMPKDANKHLYRAWHKYGCRQFVFALLEKTDMLDKQEDFWVNTFHANEREYGYNQTLIASSTAGTILSPINIQTILTWILKYKDRYNRFPTSTSGVVDVDDRKETWGAIDVALMNGYRGLPQGSSLAKLIVSEFKIINNTNRPHFSMEQIITWIEKYYGKYHLPPTQHSGVIEWAKEDGFEPMLSWKNIQSCLWKGERGLVGNSSLPKVFDSIFNIPVPRRGLDYTKDIITKWVYQFYAKHGRYPSKRDGVNEFANTDGYYPIQWASIDRALVVGCRGLPGGSSLSKLKKGIIHGTNN